MVCTFPAGPNGKFTCSNPINKSNGHLKDISGYRTPEEMVSRATSSCPDQRKLTSSTHLVWGCGFAATGNSNSLDRSDGVDVQGRRTYYCYPKQTSCRKETP